MKTQRFLIVFVVTLMCAGVMADKTVTLHKKGGVKQTLMASDIDSITFGETASTVSIEGQAQKGPFVTGSSLTAYDLMEDLSPTGRSYNALIINNQGDFRLNNIGLSSGLASLRVDGYYFNEVLGESSSSPLTLYALTNLNDSGRTNINLMTHLEKPRVEYLMEQGTHFRQAKAQAQGEILAIFTAQADSLRCSERLSIVGSNNDDALLLAITTILQGYRTISDMTELLTDIAEDLRTDGTLDRPDLGSAMINHAVFLDAKAIRKNLKAKYSLTNPGFDALPFEQHLNRFINQSGYTVTKSLIDYPAEGNFGVNILVPDDTLYLVKQSDYVSFAANVTKGLSLMVRITGLAQDTVTVYPDSLSWFPYWNCPRFAHVINSVQNWTIGRYDSKVNTQTFTCTESGRPCDLQMRFDPGPYTFEYYEKGLKKPTRIKHITVVQAPTN